MQNAVLVARNIGQIAITKRTADQAEMYDAALEHLRDNGRDFFVEVNNKFFSQLDQLFSVENNHVGFEDTISDIEYRLDDIEVPALPKSMDEETIKGYLFELAQKRDSVLAILEKLVPIESVYSQIFDHANNVCKAVCASSKDWEGDSFFAIATPDKYVTNRLRLSSIIEQAKIKSERFAELFRTISRVITVETTSSGSSVAFDKEKPAWMGRTNKK